MAPSNFAKAKAERETLRLTLATLGSTLLNHATSPLDKSTTEVVLEMAKNAQEELMANQLALQLSTPGPDEMEEFTDEYPTLLSTAVRHFAALRGILMSFPAVTPSASTSSHPLTPTQPVEFKLPRLEIPTFSGNLEEWIAFRDLFERAIDSNSLLSRAQKLTYLKSYLTGEAARHIATIVISDANYDIAWNQLKTRYQNDRELMFNILRRLINQPVLIRATAEGIRSIIDTTQGCIRSLEVLQIQVQHWDAIIIFIIFNKLDQSSKELWEQQLPDSSIPTYSNMISFLEQRARSLAAGTSYATVVSNRNFQQPQRRISVNYAGSSPKQLPCVLQCTENHQLFRCPRFVSLTVQDRKETLKQHGLCFNCLGNHHVNQCKSSFNCRVCNQRHNSMIHQESVSTNTLKEPGQGDADAASISSLSVTNSGDVTMAVLATALIRVKDIHGNSHVARCLLDGGSPVSFISDNMAKQLQLVRNSIQTRISGIGCTPAGTANASVPIVFKPHFTSSESFSLTAIVMKKITTPHPCSRLVNTTWKHLDYITLADPTYYKPGTIDILLGADIFYTIIEGEKRYGPPDAPYAVRSSLGWLVAGMKQTAAAISVNLSNITLEQQVQRFWEAESIPETPVLTEMEQQCESHFVKHQQRLSNERFQVAIPWKQPFPPVGQSKHIALRQFLKLESDFTKIRPNELQNIKRRKQYDAYKLFMKEYEELGHMTRAHPPSTAETVFYIPHHFVEKESSTTTKLRVVFNASCKTSSGVSANDCMMTGPTLQDPVHINLLRFRLHRIAYTADVEKMYRQIQVTAKDANMLRILWRASSNQPVEEYKLNTVTYGTTAAPYLAVRSLRQLALDEVSQFPKACTTVLNDFLWMI